MIQLNNPDRKAIMERRHHAPSLSATKWARIGDFVMANRNQLEGAQDLAHAHRIICQQGGTKPKGKDWLASVLQIMAINGVLCAGYPVESFENGTVEVYTKSSPLRKARAC